MLAVLALASTTALNLKPNRITPPKLPRQCAAAFASLVVAAAAPFSASAAMSDPAAVGRCVELLLHLHVAVAAGVPEHGLMQRELAVAHGQGAQEAAQGVQEDSEEGGQDLQQMPQEIHGEEAHEVLHAHGKSMAARQVRLCESS